MKNNKIVLVKKSKRLDMMLKDKESPLMLWVSILLDNDFWECSLHLTVCLPSKNPLEVTKYSFVNDYKLEIALGLGMEACVYFFLLWDPM